MLFESCLENSNFLNLKIAQMPSSVNRATKGDQKNWKKGKERSVKFQPMSWLWLNLSWFTLHTPMLYHIFELKVKSINGILGGEYRAPQKEERKNRIKPFCPLKAIFQAAIATNSNLLRSIWSRAPFPTFTITVSSPRLTARIGIATLISKGSLSCVPCRFSSKQDSSVLAFVSKCTSTKKKCYLML